jgi:hypothetical protein
MTVTGHVFGEEKIACFENKFIFQRSREFQHSRQCQYKVSLRSIVSLINSTGGCGFDIHLGNLQSFQTGDLDGLDIGMIVGTGVNTIGSDGRRRGCFQKKGGKTF